MHGRPALAKDGPAGRSPWISRPWRRGAHPVDVARSAGRIVAAAASSATLTDQIVGEGERIYSRDRSRTALLRDRPRRSGRAAIPARDLARESSDSAALGAERAAELVALADRPARRLRLNITRRARETCWRRRGRTGPDVRLGSVSATRDKQHRLDVRGLRKQVERCDLSIV